MPNSEAIIAQMKISSGDGTYTGGRRTTFVDPSGGAVRVKSVLPHTHLTCCSHNLPILRWTWPIYPPPFAETSSCAQQGLVNNITRPRLFPTTQLPVQARIFIEGGDSINQGYWVDENRQAWLSIVSLQPFPLTERDCVELFDRGVDVRVWDIKDKVCFTSKHANIESYYFIPRLGFQQS